MKYWFVGVAALLMAAPAFAESGFKSDRQGAWPNTQSWTPPSRRLYESQSSCGPDRGEPVWGAGNALLGYACVPEGANGS